MRGEEFEQRNQKGGEEAGHSGLDCRAIGSGLHPEAGGEPYTFRCEGVSSLCVAFWVDVGMEAQMVNRKGSETMLPKLQ